MPSDGFYGYTPTDWVCIVFIVSFALSTVTHVFQSLRYKHWYLLPTAATAGLVEVLGWSGRYWSSQNVDAKTPFLMQICTTIMAPTFLIAAYFFILGQIIQRVGTSYSRLSPRMYAIVFLSADVVALTIQAIGGAQASAADTLEGANKGAQVMLGGIVIQLVAITLFSILLAEFLLRLRLHAPLHPSSSPSTATEKLQSVPLPVLSSRTKLMILGTYMSMLFLLIRSIYRTIELADGWDGSIITNELYFNVLDGAMIILAMFSLNVLHPGVLLRTETSAEKKLRSNSTDSDAIVSV